MDYETAMEAAGAKILVFQSFGSYQGDWFAKVQFERRVFWVKGSYGSCSVCDAFQAEFGFSGEESPSQTALADFGRQYLSDSLTQKQAEEAASENIEWDWEAESMLAFVKANAIIQEELT